MSWPQATRYSAVIQAPAACFSDPELKQGHPDLDALFGLPLSFAGNFANVYKIVGPGEQAWAVKCFTRAAPDRQLRYQRISRYLQEHRKRFVVEHRYLDEGIHVGGAWFPVVKMRWVEGHALNDFARDHAGNALVLDQLAGLWLRLAAGLREARIAHGDLQHGNVLLVAGKTADALVLRLVDYDGLWVPDVADLPPGEVGHANYQHPARLREGDYGPEMDRFAHLVIYTALRCLAAGGKELWERFDNGENLLFREADLRDPVQSRLLPALMALPDASARALVGHLVCASQAPLDQVPLLADLLSGGKVAPLAREQVELLARLVPSSRASKPAAVPALPGPLSPAPQAEPVAPVAVLLPAAPAFVVRELLPNARPAEAPPAARAKVALPPPPDWLLRLGLSPDGAVARLWPVTLATVFAAPLLALLAWLAWPPPHQEPPPARSAARLLSLRPPRVLAGRVARMLVAIDRGTGNGPLRLAVTGLPAQVTVDVAPVPEGTGVVSVGVSFAAPLDREETAQAVTFQLLGRDGLADEQQAVLIVEKFLRPRFGSFPAIRLSPGETAKVAPPIQANGSGGPWELRFSGLPDSVELTPGRGATASLRAGADAPAAVKIISVELLSEGLVADKAAVTLSVERSPGPVRVDVKAPAEVALKTGGKVRLKVALTRHNWRGSVTLRVTGLPAGVTAGDATAPTDSDEAEVELRAVAAAAVPRLRQRAVVAAVVNGEQVGHAPFWLHMTQEAP